MSKPEKKKPRGNGKSVLSFFLGMIMGVVLFVGAIAGTIYAVVATMTVGDVVHEAGANPDDIFDQNSDVPDKSILDIALQLKDDAPNIGNMSLNELSQKYGVSTKLEDLKTIEGIDISVIFDVPINQIKDNLIKILDNVTLNNIGDLAGLDFAGYGIPILTDNLNIPVVDAIDVILETIGGELTLRQIDESFGISLGEGGIFDTIKDTPLSSITDVIDGLRVGQILDTDNDKFVKVGENSLYIKTERYEKVEADEFDTMKDDALSYMYGMDGDTLLERELRFVKKTSVDEDGNEYVVTDENGDIVYVVDNSCYDETPDTTKEYYRFFEYELYQGQYATSEYYVKAYGNHFEKTVNGYELVDEGFILLSDLSNKSGKKFATSNGTVTLPSDIYYTVDEALVLADSYGIDEFIHTIDSSTLLVAGKTGFARIHIGETDSPIQVISYLQIGNIDTATDELQNLKLGDVIDINENSAHILQVMKDTCLSDFSMSIDDLLLSEVIDITNSFYYEDINGDYVFVTLPTDKYVEYDQDLHGDKDKYILRYEESAEGKYVLKGGQYFYYDEDDLALEGLQRYARRFYLADGTEPSGTVYYAHESGGYYTLYNPTLHQSTAKRYTKVNTPEEMGNFRDYILAENWQLQDEAIAKYYWNGSEMVLGVQDGKPAYVVGVASSKVIQRLASTTIGDLSDAFDQLILGDVIDISPDRYEITYNTSDTSKQYYYEDNGLFIEASQEFIAENSDLTYFVKDTEGTSHAIMKMMAYLPVLEIGDRMNDIINELYLEDIIDIYEFSVVAEDVAGFGSEGEYFMPTDSDYNQYANGETYQYAFIPDKDGRYYLRDYHYFALSAEQASLFMDGNGVSFKYVKPDLSSKENAAIALAEISLTSNAYFMDLQGNMHHNPALCAYIISRYINHDEVTWLGYIYTRVIGAEYSLPTYINPTYNGEYLLYVNILGAYVPYDPTSLVHADLDKYLRLTEGYALVDKNSADTRDHFYLTLADNGGEMVGTFTNVANGAMDLAFIKNSVKRTEGGVDLYYYVPVDGVYSADRKNGITHQTYSKQLAEKTYVATTEADATHVFANGDIYQIGDMPEGIEEYTFVKESYGTMVTLLSDANSVLAFMPGAIKVNYIQKQSVVALQAFASHDVKVGSLNDALDNFTVSDMIDIAPDSMFDDEDIKFAKINELSKVFQSKLKGMTINDILNWGNITSASDDVLSIIGTATLEDFLGSLTYNKNTGDIYVDVIKLYMSIYNQDNLD